MSTSFYYKDIQCPTSDPPPILRQSFSSNRPIYIHRDPDIPICCSCNTPIDGNLVKALGKSWHPEHFCCSRCGQVLKSPKFYIYKGLPYCREDYANLCLKRCSGCNLPIEDVVVMGLGRPWHRSHFVCSLCGVPLLNKGGYHEKEDAAYCTECFQTMFVLPKNKSDISSTAIIAGDLEDASGLEDASDELFDGQLSADFDHISNTSEMYYSDLGEVLAETLTGEDDVKVDVDGSSVWYFGQH